MRGLASGSSSLSTLVQVLPRLPSVIRSMRPTWHLPALSALDPGFLERHHIRGLIWDVDGTLTGDRRAELLPDVATPFRALLGLPQLRHVMLSNAGEERFRQLGGMFPAVPLVRAYALGAEVLYRRRLGADDSWTPVELEQRLAEGARAIRKPSAALVDYAVRELGCPRDDAVMIGDQYITDVAGANLAQVRSIKVPTLAKESFRVSVRVSHAIEVLIYRVLYGRPAAFA